MSETEGAPVGEGADGLARLDDAERELEKATSGRRVTLRDNMGVAVAWELYRQAGNIFSIRIGPTQVFTSSDELFMLGSMMREAVTGFKSED